MAHRLLDTYRRFRLPARGRRSARAPCAGFFGCIASPPHAREARKGRYRFNRYPNKTSAYARNRPLLTTVSVTRRDGIILRPGELDWADAILIGSISWTDLQVFDYGLTDPALLTRVLQGVGGELCGNASHGTPPRAPYAHGPFVPATIPIT